MFQLSQVVLLLASTCIVQAYVDHFASNHTVTSNQVFLQRHIAADPPLPILQIGWEHIASQINSNASQPGNATCTHNLTRRDANSSTSDQNKRAILAKCSPESTCIDGSCCNSEGQCGFTPYHCQTTEATACISNCGSNAMCGIDSANSSVKCPFNMCCSALGYCGMTNAYCDNTTATGKACQSGYGGCEVIPAPICNISDKTTTNGRKVAYWQAGNTRWRPCNRIYPSQINTKSLTHLILAFASIDPVTFAIVPADPADLEAYKSFTNLKSTAMETWISIGGGALTDPGAKTLTTWSDLAGSESGRAAFIKSLEQFMVHWGFQGVDLDWEFPTSKSRGGRPEDTANFVQLVKEMRGAWGEKFGISIAIPIDFSDLSGYDVASMSQYLDFFNAMAYDLHGAWEMSYLPAIVRPQTSILDIEADILPFWFAHLPPSKVNLGLAAYGRGYTLLSPTCNTLNCPYTGPSLPGPCTNSPGLYLSPKSIPISKPKT